MKWWFLAVFAFLGLSVYLLVRLRRPSYVGSSPHCRHCGYDVTGNQSGRCPECGYDLSGSNTVLGRRARRPGLITLTLVSAAAFAYTSFVASRQVDWYRFHPDGWVVKDAAATDAAVAQRAWGELSRRRTAGTLSPKADQALLDLALTTHAKPAQSGGPIEGQLIAHLIEHFGDRKLNPAQLDRFYRQEVTFFLQARPKVVAGDALPMAVDCTHRSRGSGTRGYEFRKVSLSRSDPGNVGQTPIPLDVDALVLPDTVPPGDYLLSADVEVRLDLRETRTDAWHWTGKNLLTAPVRVYPKGTADLVTWNDRPALATPLRRALKATFNEFPVLAGSLHLALAVNAPPCDFAFDVFIRFNGREHSIGQFTGAGGRTHTRYYYPTDLELQPGTDAEVILRASESAAKGTTDLFQIWKGELVVPALWPKR
jgi:hypothetical protein